MIEQIIPLFFCMAICYVSMVNVTYFLFNPFFDYRLIYWTCYTGQFKLKEKEVINNGI